MRAVKARVRGRVQGVGFRQSCRVTARGLGLTGWVRNLSDGSVELMAQGEGDALDKLVAWLWAGPVAAEVTGVESDSVATEPALGDFHIYPNPTRSG